MNEEKIWNEGFKAGEALHGQPCPYPAGSREAWVWQKGWVEGASKRMGYAHAKRFSDTDAGRKGND